MLKIRIWLILFCLGYMLNAQAEIWRFASEESHNDVQDIYAQAFARTIKANSHGKITVRLYYYGQLGTENDIIESVANGTIQFVTVGAGHLGSYVPEIQAVGLPYLLGTDEAILHPLLTQTDSAIYHDLSPKFARINLHLLSMISEGEMVWGSNTPIHAPKDLKNLKIRTFTSTLPVATYQAFGAVPTPLSWGEVYGALQLTTIDGMVNPPYFIYNAKWYEHQKYLTFPGLQSYISTFITNNDWYQALPDEKKALIAQAKQAADKAAYDYQLRINQEDMKKIRKENPELQVITFTKAEQAPFKALSITLRQTYLDIVTHAYPEPEKAAMRKDAEQLLRHLEAAAHSSTH